MAVCTVSLLMIAYTVAFAEAGVTTPAIDEAMFCTVACSTGLNSTPVGLAAGPVVTKLRSTSKSTTRIVSPATTLTGPPKTTLMPLWYALGVVMSLVVEPSLNMSGALSVTRAESTSRRSCV